MAELDARDAKLVQYLNEAYGKEKELETALQAHIAMTTRAPYRKRLQQHLGETKQHARQLERRVKQLGGSPQTLPIDAPEPLVKGAQVAVEVGSRALAAAQGPLHAIRGTSEQEKMLKNAKTEYREEHEEIATYAAIESLAKLLGDSETAKLARTIRREEESMARFLLRQIPALTKAVAQEEIPAAQRRGGSTRRRSTSRRAATKRVGTGTATARKRASSKASGAKAGARKSASAKPGRAKAAASKPSGRKAGTSKAGTSRAGASRAGASKAGASKAGASRAGARKVGARKAGTIKATARKAGSTARS